MTAYTFDQLITFTRTSAATYVGSNGLVAVTPASRNLLTYTQEFDNAAWTKSNATVTANSATAPDGTLTGDTLVAMAGTAVHWMGRTATVTAATAYTFSVYVKAGTSNFIQLLNTGDAQAFANFNVATGAVDTTGSKTTASIVSVGNGWYRCIVTFNTTASLSNDHRFYMVSSSAATYGESWTATGTESILIWGAQLEAASAASTYTRNNGGVYPPRFDYDPVTLAPRGLLIEEQRTNLLTYSEDWTNAAWSKTNITVTAAATTSPDGTVDAQKLEATATAATSIIAPTATVAATAATFSVYVKQGTGATTANIFTLRNATTATNLIRGTLNYSTGVFTYTTGSTGVTAVNAGNGWWRIVMTATSGITSGDTIRGYVGFDGVSQTAGDHLFAWGAQLEAGAFATSYIPTVASQVTRTADVAAITAPMFAPWYRQSEGTLVVKLTPRGVPSGGANVRVLEINDGGANNRNPLLYASSAGSTYFQYRVGGVDQAGLSSSAGYFAANTTITVASAYAANDFAASFSGSAATTDNSGSVVTNATQMTIGYATSAPTEVLCGHIQSIDYYPTRLTNAQIQALTA